MFHNLNKKIITSRCFLNRQDLRTPLNQKSRKESDNTAENQLSVSRETFRPVTTLVGSYCAETFGGNGIKGFLRYNRSASAII